MPKTQQSRHDKAASRAGAELRRQLAGQIGDVFFSEALFDLLPDVVFFVKDKQSRYVLVNQTLAKRCGMRDKAAMIGRHSADVFPAAYAGSYLEQDRSVLTGGADIRDRLELHLYPDRAPGWCITHKMALRDGAGNIVGLSGISRDLGMPDKEHPVYRRISAAAEHIRANYDQPIQLAELARIAGLSASQIERYFQRIFHLTPRQMIIKTRLDAATAMLAGGQSITNIALACGYHDHSAFTRQFKERVGVTPSHYRATQKA